MSNATQSLAGTRITSLLDANSFVEIGQGVTYKEANLTFLCKKLYQHQCKRRYPCIEPTEVKLNEIVYWHTKFYLLCVILKPLNSHF